MRRHLNPIMSAVVLAVLIAISAGAENLRPSWHPSGYGGGGRFTNIAIDPSNPKTVYVGSDVAGIYRSRDGGNHFELIGKGLEGFMVADIAINPAAPHQIASLTDDGLYYSINQGDDWIRISGEIRYPSRFFGSRLLLFTRNSLWIGTDTKGVFKIPLNNLKAPPQPVQGLERFKVNGLTVYEGYLYAGTSRGVYRMEGKVWKPQHQGLLHGSAEITDIASSRNSLYLVEKQGGLFRWNAKTLTWESRPVALEPKAKGYKSLLVHPNNPDLVFIGSHPENWPHLLFKTRDGGTTWKSVLSFQVDPKAPPNWTSTFSGLEEMAFVPGTSQSLFLADWWNLWQTADDGEHWYQKHHGLQNTVINDLKIHPRNPKILYLCAADNGLMISEDAGKKWRRSMNGVADGHAQEIEIFPSDPSRMVLLMNPWDAKGKIHVYESRNAGATWKDIGFSVPRETLPKRGYVDGLATNVELDPFAADTIYVGTNGYGVYKTVNAGKNWSPMNQGLTTPYIKGPGALLVHPRLPGVLFAGTQAGGIYKSTNGAISWQRVTTGGDRFVFGMAIDPSTPSRIVAGCAGNTLLISSNEGKSWQEIHLPVTASPQMAVYSVAFHPRRPGLVLAGTTRYDVRATEGLFVSTDSAKTFRQVPMDIPKVNMMVITSAAEEPAAAYIGFNGTGIFRIELGEKP
ncbi:MAG: hypothetical protein FD159_665 [Syntrophaceae bacterium]|nr:MAG: hypothetical protein FD159_665 [Syntrophaceae bacterium]